MMGILPHHTDLPNHQQPFGINNHLERVAGIEPAYSAWKAAALPLSYTRTPRNNSLLTNGGGGWIRTNVAYATDLQSAPFNHSGTPPLHRQSRAMRHHYNQILITYSIQIGCGLVMPITIPSVNRINTIPYKNPINNFKPQLFSIYFCH